MSEFTPPAPLADAHKASILFLGTKDFALPSFERLISDGWNIVGLITQPDRPQGRKQEIVFSEIKKSALAHGIPVFQPENLNSEEGVQIVSELKPSILVTVAYGQILKPYILNLAAFGGVNLHGSLLPKYRGAAPVARAIQNGEKTTGVTVISMSSKVDAGGILSQSLTEIGPEENAFVLEARLALIGSELLGNTLKEFLEGRIRPEKQDTMAVTKAPKLSKEESDIDWSLTAFGVDRFIRAMNPWPLARTKLNFADGRTSLNVVIHHSILAEECVRDFRPGDVVNVGRDGIDVACIDSRCVRFKIIQTQGRKAMPSDEWARGTRVSIGDRFSSG